MNMTFRALALGGALILAAATLHAQDTTTPEQPAAPPAAASDLAMGQDPNGGLPGPNDAEVGGIYLAAAFEKWEQRCTKTADGADPCQLYQLLLDKDGNSVAEINMFNLPAGGEAVAGATFVAPLETLLTANLKITVDSGQTRIYPFAFCTKQGCVARLGFTADELVSFKKGAKATVTIVPAVAPDQNVDLDMSLKGFTAGFDAVAAANGN